MDRRKPAGPKNEEYVAILLLLLLCLTEVVISLRLETSRFAQDVQASSPLYLAQVDRWTQCWYRKLCMWWQQPQDKGNCLLIPCWRIEFFPVKSWIQSWLTQHRWRRNTMSPNTYLHRMTDSLTWFNWYHLLIEFKRPHPSPTNGWPKNPAAILEGFWRNPSRTGIRIIATQDMVNLVNDGRFE